MLKEILDETGRINDRILENQHKSGDVDKHREDSLKKEEIKSQEYLWWLNGSRALVVVIAFFLIRFLASLYRYHRNLATYFAARGDVLLLSRIIPSTIPELAAIFAPSFSDDEGSKSFLDELISSAKGILGGQPKAS